VPASAPDPKSGEAAVLFVVADPAALDEAAVLGHCRANLTGYKVPRRVFVVREIPKSAVGKIRVANCVTRLRPCLPGRFRPNRSGLPDSPQAVRIAACGK
jgi:acyl-CoA synthetase (AMP-forming)/AMP-acid ligase II